MRTPGLGLEGYGEQKTTRCFVISPKATKGPQLSERRTVLACQRAPFIWADLVCALLCCAAKRDLNNSSCLAAVVSPAGFPPK